MLAFCREALISILFYTILLAIYCRFDIKRGQLISPATKKLVYSIFIMRMCVPIPILPLKFKIPGKPKPIEAGINLILSGQQGGGGEGLLGDVIPAAATLPPETKPVILNQILLIVIVVWLSIAVFLFCYDVVYATYDFRKQLVLTLPEDGWQLDVFMKVKKELGIKSGRLWCCREITRCATIDNGVTKTEKWLPISPFVMGIVSIKLVMTSWEKWDVKNPSESLKLEFECICRHELLHIKRHDMLLILLSSIVKCLYWWNPIIKTADKRFRRAIENACDQAVVFGKDEEYRAFYKSTVFSSLSGLLAAPESLVSFRDSEISERRFYLENNDKLVDGKGFFVVMMVLISLGLFNASLEYGLLGDSSVIRDSIRVPRISVESTERTEPVESKADDSDIISVVESLTYPISNPTDIRLPDIFIYYRHELPINRLLFYAPVGTTIYAPISGEIVVADYKFEDGAGNMVKIKSDNFYVSVKHLSSIDFKVGQKVQKNDILSTIDDSGYGEICCEIEVTDLNNRPIDLSYLLDSSLT